MFGATMMSKLAGVALLFATGLAVSATARADMLVPAEERAETFVVGRISSDLRRTLPRLDAMANHMAGKLADVGYRRGHGVVVGSLEEMAALLRDGQIDMISESPLSALRLSQTGGAEIALREWKDKVPVYRGVIVVAKNSPVQSLAGMRGRRLVLEDRGSTTGFLLPLAALQAAGLSLVELPTLDAPVPDGKVGYVFSGNELNIASWTSRGLVDAGAFSDLDLEDSDRTPKRMRNDLRVIHLSPPVLRSVALLRAGLPAERRARIVAELLALGTDETAQTVRHEYYRLRRYDALDAEAQRSLEDIRAAVAALGSAVMK